MTPNILFSICLFSVFQLAKFQVPTGENNLPIFYRLNINWLQLTILHRNNSDWIRRQCWRQKRVCRGPQCWRHSSVLPAWPALPHLGSHPVWSDHLRGVTWNPQETVLHLRCLLWNLEYLPQSGWGQVIPHSVVGQWWGALVAAWRISEKHWG